MLSGELPPAMGKTALFYHSGGSSGYESMLRDSSENTGSTSSAQDSLSEHSSATTSSRRSSKGSKKSRSNTGQIHLLSQHHTVINPFTHKSLIHKHTIIRLLNQINYNVKQKDPGRKGDPDHPCVKR